VQRQRAVGAQQADEIHRQARARLAAGGREAAHRGRLEGQRRVLAEAHGVVARTQRGADARLVRMGVFEQAQDLEEIHAGGPLEQLALEVYRIAHAPPLAGQRMISPRATVRITVSVNALIDTYCAKKWLSTRRARRRRPLRRPRRPW
jgi:DNA-binding PucR family transcriptional regulator